MVSPKALQALLVFLFITSVTVGLFFVLSQQLAPLLEEISRTAAPNRQAMTASMPPPPLPATLTAMNEVLAATVAPLALSTTPTPTTPSIAPVAPIVQMGIVNGDTVNVRSYPDLAGDIVGQARQGTRLEILETSTDGKWLRVCCPLGTSTGERQSWIAAEFVTVQAAELSTPVITPANTTPVSAVQLIGTPSPPSGTASGTIMGTVNGSGVNLRSGPGTMFAVVGQAQEQSAIQLTGRDVTSTWWQICCPPGAPSESWISAEFVDLPIPNPQALTLVPVVTTAATPVTTPETGAP